MVTNLEVNLNSCVYISFGNMNTPTLLSVNGSTMGHLWWAEPLLPSHYLTHPVNNGWEGVRPDCLSQKEAPAYKRAGDNGEEDRSELFLWNHLTISFQEKKKGERKKNMKLGAESGGETILIEHVFISNIWKIYLNKKRKIWLECSILLYYCYNSSLLCVCVCVCVFLCVWQREGQLDVQNIKWGIL